MKRFFDRVLVMLLFVTFCSVCVLESLEAATTYSDTMEKVEGWAVGGESGTSSELNAVPGKVGKAIEIDYEFVSGSWIQMQSNVMPLNIKDAEDMKFYYKGKGAINTLQVKLEDADGSTFGINLNGATNTEGLWEQAIISMDELIYFWGGDEDLDSANIKKIYFAITKEEGGAGIVAVDQIEFAGKKSLLY